MPALAHGHTMRYTVNTGGGGSRHHPSPDMTATFLTAEQVLTIAEDKLDQASTDYMRQHAAVIGCISVADLADFRHAVRNAGQGAIVHVSGCMAQLDHYTCEGQLSDGTRLFSAMVHGGIDADDWAMIVD